MTGSIVGSNGGIYQPDGNIFLTAGYNKYISTIFADLYSKDLRNGHDYSDIFSTSLNTDHPCWNKWCMAQRIDNSPEPTGHGEWWEVFTGGIANRAFQIAIGIYTHQRNIYIRFKHDETWSEWQKIISTNGDIIDSQGHSLSETYNKVTQLENKFNNLFTQSGNTLTINY